MKHHLPYASEIKTNKKCHYGCGLTGKYKFNKGIICCSKHYNSCPSKRKSYSLSYKKEWGEKSLDTRTKLGITKISQIKGGETRKKNGHYKKLAVIMQELWEKSPWSCGLKAEFKKYKNTNIPYQGSYEYLFLESLDDTPEIDKIQRGPSIWYLDSDTQTKRLYLPDFILNNTIYEIKSKYTLKSNFQKNLDKFNAVINSGYALIIVLHGIEIKYDNERQFKQSKSLREIMV
jgi:hypothetical protein